ncbi:urease accessory protein UreE [Zavarzinia sp. CC-PAN008]|uniref:urease accessory protein UreE n=1 Tax=Zavarzinia sp. CC-PAN008 TaxID=3243332 RepID=UPI003F746E83
MRRITGLAHAGTFDASAAVDRVVLDHDARHRRRIRLESVGGRAFLLDLAQAARLRDGDGLVLDDGAVVVVEAAHETLAEISARDRDDLVRIAWHLGNRHLPTQLLGDRLRIRDDHVIVDMVRGLGGTVTMVQAPFDPEGGAYSAPATHGHHHHDGDGHDHDHPHDHGGHHHHD